MGNDGNIGFMAMYWGPMLLGFLFMGIGWVVSNRLKSKFTKYSKQRLNISLTGKQVAEKMLEQNGIYDVKVIHVNGQLTDHYNPMNKTVNLSDAVYSGISVAATAVAAHECGHALQHAQAYAPLTLRSKLVPVQNISSKVLNFAMMALMFGSYLMQGLIPLDVIIYVMIAGNLGLTLFAMVTLPVEFDASNRALAWIENNGIVSTQEYDGAKDALKWAALTYVVAALAALSQLIFWVLMLVARRD
jgi:Zn-dependent membrane protease YugP